MARTSHRPLYPDLRSVISIIYSHYNWIYVEMLTLQAMNLSFKNMCKLRPLLKEWLEGQEAAVANGVNVEELRTIEIAKVITVTSLLID